MVLKEAQGSLMVWTDWAGMSGSEQVETLANGVPKVMKEATKEKPSNMGNGSETPPSGWTTGQATVEISCKQLLALGVHVTLAARRSDSLEAYFWARKTCPCHGRLVSGCGSHGDSAHLQP